MSAVLQFQPQGLGLDTTITLVQTIAFFYVDSTSVSVHTLPPFLSSDRVSSSSSFYSTTFSNVVTSLSLLFDLSSWRDLLKTSAPNTVYCSKI